MKFVGHTYRHAANAIAVYIADLRIAAMTAESIARQYPTSVNLELVRYWNDALQETDDLVRVIGSYIGQDMGTSARLDFNSLVSRLASQRESELLKGGQSA